jgi:hypothetical protein
MLGVLASPARSVTYPVLLLQVLRQRMAALQAADDTKRAAAHAKNSLESYIIARRNALQVWPPVQ